VRKGKFENLDIRYKLEHRCGTLHTVLRFKVLTGRERHSMSVERAYLKLFL